MPLIHAWFPASICWRATDSIGLLWARHVEQYSNKNITINFPVVSFHLSSDHPPVTEVWCLVPAPTGSAINNEAST
jgi:hypothetical protein